MKIRITYDDSVNLECVPEDIADRLPLNATDDAIFTALADDISTSASDREWPTFGIDAGDRYAAIAAVRAEIEKRRKPAKRGGK